MQSLQTNISSVTSNVTAVFQTNVNNVHAALIDSLWGFKECASVVPDSRLKMKFDIIALERERMVRELEIRAGASKSTSGSMKGSLNRTWTKIKSSLSSGGIQHVLDDLAQEEANLKKTYDNALTSAAVDSALNGLLLTHLRNIESHLSELRIICGEAKYGNKWDLSTQSAGEVLKEKLQTTGHSVSSTLSTTGTAIKDTLQSTGHNISTKFSTSGVAVKDKLGLGQTTQTQTHTETVTSSSSSTTGTTGHDMKEKLQATGTAIKENLQAAGMAIKDKLSNLSLTTQPSMNPTGDKLTAELQKSTAPVNTDHTSGQVIAEKLQTTGTSIKDNLQATGTAIKDKWDNLSLTNQSMNPTGDKLTQELQKTTSIDKPAVTGVGEGQQHQNLHTVNF